MELSPGFIAKLKATEFKKICFSITNHWELSVLQKAISKKSELLRNLSGKPIVFGRFLYELFRIAAGHKQQQCAEKFGILQQNFVNKIYITYEIVRKRMYV